MNPLKIISYVVLFCFLSLAQSAATTSTLDKKKDPGFQNFIKEMKDNLNYVKNNYSTKDNKVQFRKKNITYTFNFKNDRLLSYIKSFDSGKYKNIDIFYSEILSFIDIAYIDPHKATCNHACRPRGAITISTKKNDLAISDAFLTDYENITNLPSILEKFFIEKHDPKNLIAFCKQILTDKDLRQHLADFAKN